MSSTVDIQNWGREDYVETAITTARGIGLVGIGATLGVVMYASSVRWAACGDMSVAANFCHSAVVSMARTYAYGGLAAGVAGIGASIVLDKEVKPW